MSELDHYGPALVGAMVNVSDLVTIIGVDGRIEYVNPAGSQIFGYESAAGLVGTPVLDHIHPDDLPRVVVAMARMLEVDAEVPGRPAQLRIRRADGSYVRIEANGASGYAEDGSADRMVVTARPTVDADLHEHLMSVLTSGAPSEKSFELVPEFGLWRQPTLMHAVFVLDDEGRPLAFGSPTLTELGGLDSAHTPWAEAASTGDEVFVSVADLDDGGRAGASGLTWVRARPVLDSLHRSNAVVVMAHGEGSPLPAERSTLEFSWYALDKMAAVLDMALAWRGQTVELRRAAATDPLTGLANRAGFWSQYQVATSDLAAESVSVLCIDLDRFKPVNDTYGHAVGDALLMEVSDRVLRIVRPVDLVARLGGDEFTVVVHDLTEDQVAAIATRIVDALCRPFTISGHHIEIGASVGVATAPVSSLEHERLLDDADRALYLAKSSGRNRWVRSSEGDPPPSHRP